MLFNIDRIKKTRKIFLLQDEENPFRLSTNDVTTDDGVDRLSFFLSFFLERCVITVVVVVAAQIK